MTDDRRRVIRQAQQEWLDGARHLLTVRCERGRHSIGDVYATTVGLFVVGKRPRLSPETGRYTSTAHGDVIDGHGLTDFTFACLHCNWLHTETTANLRQAALDPRRVEVVVSRD